MTTNETTDWVAVLCDYIDGNSEEAMETVGEIEWGEGLLSVCSDENVRLSVVAARARAHHAKQATLRTELIRVVEEAYDAVLDNYDCDNYGTDHAKDGSYFPSPGNWMYDVECVLHKLQREGFKPADGYDAARRRMDRARAEKAELAAALEACKDFEGTEFDRGSAGEMLLRLKQAAEPFNVGGVAEVWPDTMPDGQPNPYGVED